MTDTVEALRDDEALYEQAEQIAKTYETESEVGWQAIVIRVLAARCKAARAALREDRGTDDEQATDWCKCGNVNAPAVWHGTNGCWLTERAALREDRGYEAADRIEALEREKAARNAIDPVTRLHNLCDGLAEHRRESPYDEESWRLADESYQAKCAELTAAQAALREAQKALEAADAMRKRWGKYDMVNEADCACMEAYDAARKGTT